MNICIVFIFNFVFFTYNLFSSECNTEVKIGQKFNLHHRLLSATTADARPFIALAGAQLGENIPEAKCSVSARLCRELSVAKK